MYITLPNMQRIFLENNEQTTPGQKVRKYKKKEGYSTAATKNKFN
jgi:hypothetical protein